MVLNKLKIIKMEVISKEEYLKVYDYMFDTKIEDVMLEKLSSEELTAAKE